MINLVFYILLGEIFLKFYSDYATTSGIAIPISTNATTTILSEIEDTHEAKKYVVEF